jgi:hypothetical protein
MDAIPTPVISDGCHPNARHSRPPKACLESSSIFSAFWIPELASQLWNDGEKSNPGMMGRKATLE